MFVRQIYQSSFIFMEILAIHWIYVQRPLSYFYFFSTSEKLHSDCFLCLYDVSSVCNMLRLKCIRFYIAH